MSIYDYTYYPCGKYSYGETEDFCLDIRPKSGGYISPKNRKTADGDVPVEFFETQDPGVSTGAVISPNPVAEFVILTLPASGTEATIEIYSNDGRLMIKRNLGLESKVRIELKGLAGGLYLARILWQDGQSEMIKFIKS